MKSLKNFFGKTKRGATSIYIVVFATILFGVVTLSFIRIMLSEAGQSSDDDLSQSAYDSAMAGVEDAKIAVNNYYKCLSEHDGNYCDNVEKINPITRYPDDPKCDRDFLLGQVLHKRLDDDFSEVPIISTSTTTNHETDTSDQAYTCVIISDVTPDYRGTLTSDTRTKVVPISVARGGVTPSYGDANAKLGDVVYIDFSWYSELNRGGKNSSNGGYTMYGNNMLHQKTEATIPPTIQLTFIKVAGGQINLDDLRQANSNSNYINSTMVLLPSSVGASPTTISNGKVLQYGQIGDETNLSIDTPVEVACGDGEFACTARLEVKGSSFSLNDGDNVFLVVSLPYGDAMTDFSVTLRRADDSTVKFHGVQISVDSTGRTNQLFRRVETRLDPADLFFPYPQYAIELGNNGDGTLIKNFWITVNCWYNQPKVGGNYCDNNNNTSP